MNTGSVLQLTEFLGTTIVALVLARFIRVVPSVVLQIVVGIIVGSGVFALGTRAFGVETLSNIGLFAIFFDVGTDFDAASPELKLAMPIWSAGAGVAASMVAVFLAGLVIGHGIGQSLLIGLATVSTSVSVSLYSFRSLGPIRHLEAKVAVIAGIFDDMMGLVVIACLAAMMTNSSHGLISLVASLLVVVPSYILRSKMANAGRGFGTVGRYAFVSALLLTAVMLWLGFGITLAMGGFVAGVFSGTVLTGTERAGLRKVCMMLGPLFLVSIGLLANVERGVSLAEAGGVIVLAAALILAKGANDLAIGHRVEDRVLYWFSMVPRAEVAGIGLVLVSPRISANFELQAILAVVVTSLVAPFVIIHRGRRISPAGGS